MVRDDGTCCVRAQSPLESLAGAYGWDMDTPSRSRASTQIVSSETQRVFVVAHPRHRESGFCVSKGMASMALCHLPARRCCAAGDVVVCVSSPAPGAQRYLLGVLRIHEAVESPLAYYGKYPSRKDAIYSVKTIRRARSSTRTRKWTVQKLAKQKGEAPAWTVLYANGAVLCWRLKANSKYHRLSLQPFSARRAWIGARKRNERARDFNGPVLLARKYLRFAAPEGSGRAPPIVPSNFCRNLRGRLRGGCWSEDPQFMGWLRWICRK